MSIVKSCDDLFYLDFIVWLKYVYKYTLPLPSPLPYRLKNLIQNTYRIDQALSAQFIYMYKMERRYMHVT